MSENYYVQQPQAVRSLTASTSDNLGIPYQRKETDVQEDFIMYNNHRLSEHSGTASEATQVATVIGKLYYVQQLQAIRSLRDSLQVATVTGKLYYVQQPQAIRSPKEASSAKGIEAAVQQWYDSVCCT